MAPRKKSRLTRHNKKTVHSAKKNIRIRMYRVGFGDCFLLSIPNHDSQNSDTYNHILIDCGVHSQGDIGTMQKVVDNISEVTNKKLVAIIATHAHQDHISGFGKFADMFTKFSIDEIWLPWTWDEMNEVARKMKRIQATLTEELIQHVEALGIDSKKNLWSVLENLSLTSNKHAINLLKSGFGDSKVKVRYLKAGNILEPDDISVPGLLVRILGPPDSEEFLAQMSPPSDQRYLRMVDGEAKPVNPIQLFEKRWRVHSKSINVSLSKEEEELLKNLAKYPLDDLAFALDKARNNESLVALFIFHNQYLLFPGDAQYGNWRWWLEKDDSADILSKINFFKVAHHGSHNATPKAALERMADGKFAAMISTQSVPWASIPRTPLMTRLENKAGKHIVRSDWLDIDNAPKPLAGAQPLPPSKLPKGFYKGDCWYDYKIDLQ
jgi:beta-lactamase superfamily II metal-dependent hydrolase